VCDAPGSLAASLSSVEKLNSESYLFFCSSSLPAAGPLTLNFVEKLMMQKEKLNKKGGRQETAFSDDGFALGMVSRVSRCGHRCACPSDVSGVCRRAGSLPVGLVNPSALTRCSSLCRFFYCRPTS
jgi:hypothetical protein